MSRTRTRLLAAAAASVIAVCHSPAAAAQAETTTAIIRFDIEADGLENALIAYAAQSGRQIVVDPSLAAGVRAPAVKGAFTADEALQRLLSQSNLAARQSGTNLYVVRPRAAFLAAGSEEPVTTLTTEASLAADRPAGAAMLDEVVVTGTLIRGGKDGASPIQQFDRGDIDRQGRATVADFLTALPQNFAGAGTAASAVLGSDGRGVNDLAATGVNLRGLGTSATLVLVNGRRMGGVGTKGDFADVSAIPTAAIERVDVLLDGASALYGSDAVGGVVNVILKRRLEGAETRLRIGAATEGGAEEIQASQTFGASWDSGDLVLAYEYGKRWGLRGEERAQTASADLTALGGLDRRGFYSRPGNILVFDAARGGYQSAWAIPGGQNGTGLRPSDFIAGATNLGDQRQGGDVLPAEVRHNLYASVSQQIGESVRLLADARYNRRDNTIARPAPLSIFTVNRSNPFFVSPDGSASHSIGYSFSDEIGPSLSDGRSESLGVSVGAEAALPGSWRGDVYAALARELGERDSERLVNTRFLNEALGAIADDPATSYRAAVDGYFNPFGAFNANGPAVLQFIGSGYTRGRSLSQVLTFDAKADGPIWTLPAGALKAAVGVQARQERFKQSATSLISTVAPVRSGGLTFKRTVQAAFVEVRAPLVSPDMDIPLADSLELSVAGRIERYDDFGQTANPKIGLTWGLSNALKLRASYGSSFRAPNMPELYQLQSASPVLLGPGGAQTLVLMQTGGNRDLEPETARTWSVGFDYRSSALPGLALSASWFDVEFKDQIGQPVLADTANALTNPAYSPFVTRIDPADPAHLARVKAIMAISTNANITLFPPEAYRAILDARFVNTGAVKVRGMDLQASYGWQVGEDQFDLSTSVTYLADFERRFTPTATPVQQLDSPNQPVALRGRLTGSWSRGAFGASATLNYVDAYRSETGRTIEAWTPIDLQARWTPAADDGALAGVSLILNVQNAFNERAPFYDNPLGLGYDPANADPVGRTISLQLAKRW